MFAHAQILKVEAFLYKKKTNKKPKTILILALNKQHTKINV